MRNLAKAKAAVKLMVSEFNESNDSPQLRWTTTSMKDSYYYGEHEMQDRMTRLLEEYNDCFLNGTGYKMEAVGLVVTSWNKKLDYGRAVLKFKLVEVK